METINGYILLEGLGEGSFGKVERVAIGDKQFAMKILFERVANELKGVAANEIEILSDLRHPYILEFVASFEDPEKAGRICIVTELCKEDFRKLIDRHSQQEEPIFESDVMEWLAMAASALKYLHTQEPPIAHHDIKPQNLLITVHRALKIADFGLASKLWSRTESKLLGTPAYCAPELFTTNGHDEKCDIWSLGRVVQEMCNLGIEKNPDNYRIRERYSADLQQIVQLMLEKNPLTRTSAKELLNMPILQNWIKKVDKITNLEKSVTKTKHSADTQSTSSSTSDTYASSSIVSVSNVYQPYIERESLQRVGSTLGEGMASLTAILDNASIGDRILIDQPVHKVVYSEETKTIYVTDKKLILGYKWNEQAKSLESCFASSFLYEIESFTIAPTLIFPNFADDFYLSVGLGEDKLKQVIKATGSPLVVDSTLETSYIDEKCYYWEVASDPERDILLIHPFFSSFIYVKVKDVPCGLVDLNSLDIHKGINQMELKQDFLFLGNGVFKYIYKCDFLITSSNGDVTVQSRNAWGPIESLAGSFGSVATDASGKQCYVITNRDTETVRAYKVGDDPKTSVQSVNLKETVAVLGIIVQNESTLLLVGKNVKNCLCAIELKESRSKQRKKEGDTGRNQADRTVERKEEHKNERNSCVIL